MKRTRFLTLAVSLVAVMPAWANAQPKDTKKKKPKTEEAAAAPQAPAKKSLSESLTGPAKADYDSGVGLYKQGEFGPASAKFMQAYEASNDARLLWNAAAAEKQQRHYAKARTYVRQYVQLSTDLSEKDKADANELVATLDRLVADVTIRVNEPGAIVTVDGAEVGESPLAKPVTLDAGSRTLKVSKPSFLPYSSSITVAGGAPQTVDVKLLPHVTDGRIAVRASEADASILLDSKVVGKGSYSGILASGSHQLGVTREGFKPYDLTFTIAENGTRSFDVTLERSKRRFPVWAVVAGSVLVAGIATAVIVIAAQPEPTRGEIREGSFPPKKVTLTDF